MAIPRYPAQRSTFTDSGLPYNQTKGEPKPLFGRHTKKWHPDYDHPPSNDLRSSGKGLYSGNRNLLRQRLMAYIDNGTAPGGFTYVEALRKR